MAVETSVLDGGNVICITVVLDSVLLKNVLDRGKVQGEKERSTDRSLWDTKGK